MHAVHAHQPMDPRIGILCREGRTVFYAFVNGYDAPEFQGTRDEVEVALGIRPGPVAERPAAATKPPPKIGVRRTYRARLRSPDGGVAEYETEAFNKAEARAQIRRHFREDTPSPRYGFYRFEQHSLEWVDE